MSGGDAFFISMVGGNLISRTRSSKSPVHLIVALGASVLTAVALLACGGASDDDLTRDTRPSPIVEIPTAASAPALDSLTVQSTPTPTPTPVPPSKQVDDTGAMSLTITGGIARYRVAEQLARRNLPNDAIGETPDVSGSIAFDPDGTVRPGESELTIDLTTLKSDESRRDGYVQDAGRHDHARRHESGRVRRHGPILRRPGLG